MLNKVQYRSPGLAKTHCDQPRVGRALSSRTNGGKVLYELTESFFECQNEHRTVVVAPENINDGREETCETVDVESPIILQLSENVQPVLETIISPSPMNVELYGEPKSLRKLSWESFKKNVYNPNKAKYAEFPALTGVPLFSSHTPLELCKNIGECSISSRYVQTGEQGLILNNCANDACRKEEVLFTPCQIEELQENRREFSTKKSSMIDPFVVANVAPPNENEHVATGLKSPNTHYAHVTLPNQNNDGITGSADTAVEDVCGQFETVVATISNSETDSAELNKNDDQTVPTCEQSSHIPANRSDRIAAEHGVLDKCDDVPDNNGGIVDKTDGITDKSCRIPDKSDCIIDESNGIANIPPKRDGIPGKTGDVTDKYESSPHMTYIITDKSDCMPDKSDSIPDKTDGIPNKTDCTTDNTDMNVSATCDQTTEIPDKHSSYIDGFDGSPDGALPDDIADSPSSAQTIPIDSKYHSQVTDECCKEDLELMENSPQKGLSSDNSQTIHQSERHEPGESGCIIYGKAYNLANGNTPRIGQSSACMSSMCERDSHSTNNEVKCVSPILDECSVIPLHLRALLTNKPVVMLNRLTQYDMEKYSRKDIESLKFSPTNEHSVNGDARFCMNKPVKAVAKRGRGRPRKIRQTVINSLVPSQNSKTFVETMRQFGKDYTPVKLTSSAVTGRSMSFWETDLQCPGDIYDFTDDERSDSPTSTPLVDSRVVSLSSALHNSYDSGKKAEERVFKSIKNNISLSKRSLPKKPTANVDINKLKEKFRRTFVKPNLPIKHGLPLSERQPNSMLNILQINDRSPTSLERLEVLELDRHAERSGINVAPLLEQSEKEPSPESSELDCTSNLDDAVQEPMKPNVSEMEAERTLPVLRQILESNIVGDENVQSKGQELCSNRYPIDHCRNEDLDGACNMLGHHILSPLSSEESVRPEPAVDSHVNESSNCTDIHPRLIPHVPTGVSDSGKNVITINTTESSDSEVEMSNNVINSASDAAYSEKQIDNNANCLIEDAIVSSPGDKLLVHSFKIREDVKQRIACRAKLCETISMSKKKGTDESDPNRIDRLEGSAPQTIQSKQINTHDTHNAGSAERNAECQDENIVDGIAHTHMSHADSKIESASDNHIAAVEKGIIDNNNLAINILEAHTNTTSVVNKSDTFNPESPDEDTPLIMYTRKANHVSRLPDYSSQCDVERCDRLGSDTRGREELSYVATTATGDINSDQSATKAAEGLLFLAGNCGRVVKTQSYLSIQTVIEDSGSSDCSTDVSSLSKESTTDINLRITSVEGSASELYKAADGDFSHDDETKIAVKNLNDVSFEEPSNNGLSSSTSCVTGVTDLEMHTILGCSQTLSKSLDYCGPLFQSLSSSQTSVTTTPIGSDSQVLLPITSAPTPVNAYFVISPVNLTQPISKKGRQKKRSSGLKKTLRPLLPKSIKSITCSLPAVTIDSRPPLDNTPGNGQSGDTSNEDRESSTITGPNDEEALDLSIKSLKCPQTKGTNNARTDYSVNNETVSPSTLYSRECEDVDGVPLLFMCAETKGSQSFNIELDLCNTDTRAVNVDSCGPSIASSPTKPFKARLDTLISNLTKTLQEKIAEDVKTEISITTGNKSTERAADKETVNSQKPTKKKRGGRRSTLGCRKKKTKKLPKLTEQLRAITPATTGKELDTEQSRITNEECGKASSNTNVGHVRSAVTKVFYTRSKAKIDNQRRSREVRRAKGRGKGRRKQLRKKDNAVTNACNVEMNAEQQEDEMEEECSPNGRDLIADTYRIVISTTDEENTKIRLRKGPGSKALDDMDPAQGSSEETVDLPYEQSKKPKTRSTTVGKGNKRKKRKKVVNSLSLEDYTGKLDGEDADELPTILPPKRRRMHKKHQQSGNLEETGTEKEDNIARLTREFPRHNWLENKIKQISTGETPSPPAATPPMEQGDIPSTESNTVPGYFDELTESSERGDNCAGNTADDGSDTVDASGNEMYTQSAITDVSTIGSDQGGNIRDDYDQIDLHSSENRESQTNAKLTTEEGLRDLQESTVSLTDGDGATVLTTISCVLERLVEDNVANSTSPDHERNGIEPGVMDLSIKCNMKPEVDNHIGFSLDSRALDKIPAGQDMNSDARTDRLDDEADNSEGDEEPRLTIDQTVTDDDGILVTSHPSLPNSATAMESQPDVSSFPSETVTDVGLDPLEGKVAVETDFIKQKQNSLVEEAGHAPDRREDGDDVRSDSLSSQGPIDLCTKSSDSAVILSEQSWDPQCTISTDDDGLTKSKQKPPVLKVHPQVHQQWSAMPKPNMPSIVSATKAALCTVRTLPDVPNNVASRSPAPSVECSTIREHTIPPVPALVPIGGTSNQLCSKSPQLSRDRPNSQSTSSLSATSSVSRSSDQRQPSIYPTSHVLVKRSMGADATESLLGEPVEKSARTCNDNILDDNISESGPIELKHNGSTGTSSLQFFANLTNDIAPTAGPVVQISEPISVEERERCISLTSEIQILEQLAARKEQEREELLQLQLQKKAEMMRYQGRPEMNNSSSEVQSKGMPNQRIIPYTAQAADCTSVDESTSTGNTNNNNARRQSDEQIVLSEKQKKQKKLGAWKGAIDLSVKQKIDKTSPLPAHIDASIESVWTTLELAPVKNSGSSNCPYIKRSTAFDSPHIGGRGTEHKLIDAAHPAHSQEPFQTAGFLITPLPSGRRSYVGHRPLIRRGSSRSKPKGLLHSDRAASGVGIHADAQHVPASHLKNNPTRDNPISVDGTNRSDVKLSTDIQNEPLKHMTMSKMPTAQSIQGNNQTPFLNNQNLSANGASNGNTFYDYVDLSRSPENVVCRIPLSQNMHFGSQLEPQQQQQQRIYLETQRSTVQEQKMVIPQPQQQQQHNQRTPENEHMIQHEMNIAITNRKFQPNGQPFGQPPLCPVSQQGPGPALYHHKLLQPGQVPGHSNDPSSHQSQSSSRINQRFINQNTMVNATNISPVYVANGKVDSRSTIAPGSRISPQAERGDVIHYPLTQRYMANSASAAFRPEVPRGNPRFVGPRPPHVMQYNPPHTGTNSGPHMMHAGMHSASSSSCHPPQLVQALRSPSIRPRMTQFLAIQQRLHGAQVHCPTQNTQQLPTQVPMQMAPNPQIAFPNPAQHAQSAYRPQQPVRQYSPRQQGPVHGAMTPQVQSASQSRTIDISGAGRHTTANRSTDSEARGGISTFNRQMSQAATTRQSPQGGAPCFYLPHGHGTDAKHGSSSESAPVTRHTISVQDGQGRLYPHSCCACGRDAGMVCSRCEGVRYCSKECQVRDWPRHGPDCKTKP